MNSINELIHNTYAYSHTCTHVPTHSESYTYIHKLSREDNTAFKRGEKSREKDIPPSCGNATSIRSNVTRIIT